MQSYDESISLYVWTSYRLRIVQGRADESRYKTISELSCVCCDELGVCLVMLVEWSVVLLCMLLWDFQWSDYKHTFVLPIADSVVVDRRYS